MTFKLGDGVTFSHHLKRVTSTRFDADEPSAYRRSKTIKAWKRVDFLVEGRGVVVGKRTLANGERYYIGPDEGSTFVPEEYVHAYLVSFDMRRKPVYVLAEDLTLIHTPKVERADSAVTVEFADAKLLVLGERAAWEPV